MGCFRGTLPVTGHASLREHSASRALPAFSAFLALAVVALALPSSVFGASSCSESPTCTNDPSAPGGVWDPHEPWSSIDACTPFGRSADTPFRTCDILIYDPMLASTFIRGPSVVYDADLRWIFACSAPDDGPPAPFMAFWSRTPDPEEGAPSIVQVTFSASPDPCPCLEGGTAPSPVTIAMGRTWDSELDAFRMWRFSDSGTDLDPILDLIFHTRQVAVDWVDPDLGPVHIVYDFDDDSDPLAMVPSCSTRATLEPCRTHGWSFVRTVSTLPCFGRYVERIRTPLFARPPAGDYCPQCGACLGVGTVCDPLLPGYDSSLCCLCALCAAHCTAFNTMDPLSPPSPSLPVWLEWPP